MRILLHSLTFHPAVGGVETISATLASALLQLGHDITVVTGVPFAGDNPFPFAVVRNPSASELLRLTRESDIVHSNGASLKMVPFAMISRKPFLWTHNGYQVTCIDGLGWDETGPTPLTPFASACHHLRLHGPVHAVLGLAKLLLRRVVAMRIAYNAAATHWIAKRQPLPRQVVLYTPYPLNRFAESKLTPRQDYDFVFVGRLVNEKGVKTLLRAMALLRSRPRTENATLLIVGDGPLRPSIEAMTASLQLNDAVTFAGMLEGEHLIQAVRSAPVGVVPSAYEEPMGGIALELLAAGLSVIVSHRGGIAECVGSAGLTFENSNSEDLAAKMETLFARSDAHLACLANAPARLLAFDQETLTRQYVAHYQHLTAP
jgi:glycosyltransferase involved in cell wall biosynthesis